jgi:cell wall-associated NlpC family hydrolase
MVAIGKRSPTGRGVRYDAANVRALLYLLVCAVLACFVAGESHGATKKKGGASSSSSNSSTKKSSASTPNPKSPPAAPPEPEPPLPKKDAPSPPGAEPAATPDPAKPKYAPSASISSTELLGFDEQPPRVQKLIEGALELSKLNLTYLAGSADPKLGGMDCSGSIEYLLKQQGFKDVPRDAAGQYTWARKHGQFFAVISKKAGGFEFAELLPGDLMFWSGTYDSQKDPPVTHSMIYLGVQRKRGQHVMWGSSDGRSYDGKPRFGVSVFDFKMPKADPGSAAPKADFLGYARIPGLRAD